MINYANAAMSALSVHRLGNIALAEEIQLSDHPLDISDVQLHGYMIEYFMRSFKVPEYFEFDQEDVAGANPVANLVAEIFDDLSLIHNNSQEIANHLFRISTNPKIKPGDLFVGHFKNLEIGDEEFTAVGIFKAETKANFLKMEKTAQGSFKASVDSGIPISKMDKACLILKSVDEPGFRVLTIDKSNPEKDALYWMNEFLKVTKIEDHFFQTAQYLQMANTFVNERLPEEFETDRSNQLNILDKSMKFFKNNDAFDEREFEVQVLEQPEIVESFKNFRNDYADIHEAKIENNFDISKPAVQSQKKHFRSVIKLDKNFHVYVHGDRSLIERGYDQDGRSFYKLYFNEES